MPPPDKSGSGGGKPPELPYTSAYVGGLQLGLSALDLQKMPYPRLALMLRAAASGRGQSAENKKAARPATQADIEKMLA